VRVRACVYISAAAGAALLATLGYFAFADTGEPGGDRPEPIVIESRERPARERDGGPDRRRERRPDRAGSPAPERAAPGPPAPASPGTPPQGFAPPPSPDPPPPVPDEDDVGDDDGDDAGEHD
jgi:hypothetical protein